MIYASVGQPCRNFNILGSTTIIDPQDGREKVVLSNFASGSTGNLILLDPDTGAGEAIPLPGDDGAWALLNLDDTSLLVGTCPRFGYLHRLDLAQRRWAEPLRDPHETYIWNLCRGSDGRIYGGTYPGCVLLRYDPDRHTLENVGRASQNPANQYSRMVYTIPGHIIVSCGMAEMHLTLWNVESGEMHPFGRPGAQVKSVSREVICTETDGELDFYSAATLATLPDHSSHMAPEPALPYAGARHMVTLRDGRVCGVRGQEYFIWDGNSDGQGAEPPLHPIPTARPPTRIHTLTSGPDGKIWGSSAFGQTIFSWDPATGDHWNSPSVCDQGGEVYGMAFVGHRLFLSAYVGGDHIVYDPAQPWDQVHNHNPRTLQPVAPALIRPEARSVIGPDGHFWTGWMARYGHYGGGLSRVDVESLEVRLWSDPVPGQPLIALAAGSHYLYFTTGGSANGLPAKNEPFHFGVWDPFAGRIIWQKKFEMGRMLGPVAAVGERVLVGVDSELWIFNPEQLEEVGVVALKEPCQRLIPAGDGTAWLFAGKDLLTFDPVQWALHLVTELPGPVSTATIGSDGTLYMAHLTELFSLDVKHLVSRYM